MASSTPAKSILKQPSKAKSQPEDEEAAAQAAKNKRNLDIALKHAYLIQHQKDTQAQILKNIETLLEFPLHAEPTSSDAKAFLGLVSIFQPSDIDDLVEERRIDIICGYALCSNKPRSYGLKESETWKLKKGAGDWCSNLCARKALFVKTQLSEVPAWERVPGQQPEIVLHEDDRHLLPVPACGNDEEAARKIQQRVAERDELAMERGERAVSFRPGQVMVEQIVEKIPEARRPQTVSKVQFASATAVEGYEPGTAVQKTKTGAVLPNDGYDGSTGATLRNAGDDASGAGPVAQELVQSHSGETEDEEQQWRDMFAELRARE